MAEPLTPEAIYREALEQIAESSCEASTWASEEPPVRDRCLDPEFVEGEPEGRCAPCGAANALRLAALDAARAAAPLDVERLARAIALVVDAAPGPVYDVHRKEAADIAAEYARLREADIVKVEQEAASAAVAEYRTLMLNGGLRIPGFDHWRERSSSKPSDPDDVRWDCSCGYAGSPEKVQRHWAALIAESREEGT